MKKGDILITLTDVVTLTVTMTMKMTLTEIHLLKTMFESEYFKP